MKIVERFLSEDGKKTFDSAEDCLQYEKLDTAAKMFRAGYEVSFGTNRADSLLTSILNDPTICQEVMEFLAKPIKFGGRPSPRTDEQLICDFVEYLRANGETSMTALHKAVRSSRPRAMFLLEKAWQNKQIERIEKDGTTFYKCLVK